MYVGINFMAASNSHQISCPCQSRNQRSEEKLAGRSSEASMKLVFALH
jgi:hypothetical protein